MTNKTKRRQKIKNRIRAIIKGTKDNPRLSVFRSNKEIYASLIDDVNGVTICSASSIEKDFSKSKLTKLEQAKIVGENLAERAKSSGVKKCSFDRNGYLFHGRVKSLADGAKTAGLKF